MSDTTRLEEWLRTVVSEYEYADGDSMAEDAAALLEELHALRTQWAAIPWDAICYAIDRMASYAPMSAAHHMDALDKFHTANAPKEAAQ